MDEIWRMKKHLFSFHGWVLIACFSLFVRAQTTAHAAELKIRMQFDTKKSTLLLNELILTKEVTLKSLIEKLGNAESIKDRKRGERTYFFEKLGLTLNEMNGKLRGITLTFHSDGDKNYVATAYKGILFMDKMNVTGTTSRKDFSQLKGYLTCGLPYLCASKNKKAAIRVLIGFEKDGPQRITQMSFLF